MGAPAGRSDTTYRLICSAQSPSATPDETVLVPKLAPLTHHNEPYSNSAKRKSIHRICSSTVIPLLSSTTASAARRNGLTARVSS